MNKLFLELSRDPENLGYDLEDAQGCADKLNAPRYDKELPVSPPDLIRYLADSGELADFCKSDDPFKMAVRMIMEGGGVFDPADELLANAVGSENLEFLVKTVQISRAQQLGLGVISPNTIERLLLDVSSL